MAKIRLSNLDNAVKAAIDQRITTNRTGHKKWVALGDTLEVDPGYLRQIYNGQRHATQAIAKALGISATRYPPHPVMRVAKLKRLAQSEYNAA